MLSNLHWWRVDAQLLLGVPTTVYRHTYHNAGIKVTFYSRQDSEYDYKVLKKDRKALLIVYTMDISLLPKDCDWCYACIIINRKLNVWETTHINKTGYGYRIWRKPPVVCSTLMSIGIRYRVMEVMSKFYRIPTLWYDYVMRLKCHVICLNNCQTQQCTE